MNDNIKRLQEQIAVEKLKISNCKHDFDDSFYNPETVKEGYGYVQDGAGSDPHWSYEGYKDVQKDRWTRNCKTCGFEQHTYNRKGLVGCLLPFYD